MFTGIIEELGMVRGFLKFGNIYRLAVEGPTVSKDIKIGDSVSINGVCLTVAEKKKDILYFDVMDQTVQRTGIGELKEGDRVNLESAIRAGKAFGGHFVLGHIDCRGRIAGIKRKGSDVSMEIEIPNEASDLVVEKGSVAVEGVSLTVGDIKDNRFRVYLIPLTLNATNLSMKKTGETVNIEFDIIGKYIVRNKETKIQRDRKVITEDFLKNKGFA